jgi:hypothetical protein
MKRTIMIGMTVLLGLMISSAVYAKDSCGCRGEGFTAITNVNIESVKKFLKDTSADRDALIIKRIELFKEFAKKSGDYDKIAGIKKEIIDLQTKVMDTAKEYGLDKTILHWLKIRHEKMERNGMGPGMMGKGKMGKGMGPDMQGCPCNTPE